MRQEKALVKNHTHIKACVKFVENQVTVGLADHQCRYVGESRGTIHDDRVTRDVIDQCRNGAGVGRIGDLDLEVAATALNKRYAARYQTIVHQRFAGIGRSARSTAIERVVAVIGQHQLPFNGIAVLQRRRKIGFLDRKFAGDRRWVRYLQGFT